MPRHASIASSETSSARRTPFWGAHSSVTVVGFARRARLHEPAVRVAVDQRRLPEIVTVGLGDPAAVEALTQHEPVRLRRRVDVQRHRRVRRVHDPYGGCSRRYRRVSPAAAVGCTASPPAPDASTRCWTSAPLGEFGLSAAWISCTPAESVTVFPLQGRTVKGCGGDFNASAVVPVTRTGNGFPSIVMRSSMHRDGRFTGIAARCTPGMPSSAIADGRNVPSGWSIVLVECGMKLVIVNVMVCPVIGANESGTETVPSGPRVCGSGVRLIVRVVPSSDVIAQAGRHRMTAVVDELQIHVVERHLVREPSPASTPVPVPSGVVHAVDGSPSIADDARAVVSP